MEKLKLNIVEESKLKTMQFYCKQFTLNRDVHY